MAHTHKLFTIQVRLCFVTSLRQNKQFSKLVCHCVYIEVREITDVFVWEDLEAFAAFMIKELSESHHANIRLKVDAGRFFQIFCLAADQNDRI